jgi:hypothetical protein
MTQFYYTYAYLREDKTPYYIGKGSGGRVYTKGKGEVKSPKDKSRIIFLKQNLTEEEAFKHEKYMIAVFGRKDNGTGILRNLTDGGEGTSGYVYTEEQRKKLSASMTPEKRSEAAKKRIANTTPENRSESVKKGWENMNPEQRSERARKRWENMNPEQRSEVTRKGRESITPEKRTEIARNLNDVKFRCTETGFITNAGALSKYQKARGIDASNRVRLS